MKVRKGDLFMDSSTAHTITLVLDLLLLASAFLAWYFRPKLGGQLAVGMRLLMVGVLILGITHLADTVFLKDYLSAIDKALSPLVHRGLNVIGFIFIFIGFFQMKKAIEA
jgi:hypothetical protein